MTSTPEGQLRQPLPWTARDTCDVCRSPKTTTVSLYGGKRCADHPDKYEPDIVLALRLKGWDGTADAYIRYWNGDQP